MWTIWLAACAPEPAPPPPAAEPVPVVGESPAAVARPVEKRNRPPVIQTLALTPAQPTFADLVRAEATATDPDGDPVTLDYTWSVDGVELSDVSFDVLRSGRHKRGSVVEVAVTASDGTATTEPMRARVTVGNAPVVMETAPRELTRIDGFRMRATDPDGEPVSWRVEGAPRGLTIDPDGTLRYQGSEDEPGGDYTLRIVAQDTGGAMAVMEVPLAINPGSKAAKQGG